MKKFLVLLLMMISVPCFGATLQQAQQYFYQGKFEKAYYEAAYTKQDTKQSATNRRQAEILQFATCWMTNLLNSLPSDAAPNIDNYHGWMFQDEEEFEENVFALGDTVEWSCAERLQLKKYFLIQYKFLDKYGYFKDYRVYDVATFGMLSLMKYAPQSSAYEDIYNQVLPTVQKYGNGRAYYTETMFKTEAQSIYDDEFSSGSRNRAFYN